MGKIIKTTPGKTYVVEDTNGCDVINTATLAVALTVEDGKQGYFVATAQEYEVGETATVVEVFKSAALAVLGGGGNGGNGGSGTPEGDYAIFDSNGAIIGGRLDNLTNGLYFQYQRESLSKWDIALPSLTQGKAMCKQCKNLTLFKSQTPSLINAEEMFMEDTSLEVLEMDLSNVTNGANMLYKTNLPEFSNDMQSLSHAPSMLGAMKKLQRVTSLFPLLKTASYMCGDASVTEWRSALPSLSDGSFMFQFCKLDKESVLIICNTIPTYESGTHKLMLGIHVDHQADEEVLAAIAAAEEKGWTLTVQWNGTPTASAASTYGLRGQLIYARVVDDEYGEHLEWGHYVTDPTVYEEFRSVDSARAYFGIEE